MRKIGIVGAIGAGKSFVGALLRNHGFRVLDADDAIHDLYRNSSDLRSVIRCAFGPYSLTGDGVNRQFFADLIFKDGNARHRLEALVYPYLSQVALDFFDDEERSYEKGARFFEAALMSKVPEICNVLDEIWVVTAPEELRLERLIARGLSDEDARRRIDTQRMLALPNHPNIREIENTGDADSLLAIISQLLGMEL